uniref:Minor histocompatibility antigen H13 n=1 Tax=Paramoeba aestuarina TaxID=180227 RepID=A0A7S4NNE3_9EUKA
MDTEMTDKIAEAVEESIDEVVVEISSCGLAIAYTSILIMAFVPIYIGSRWSLHNEEAETMSQKDAYMFPVVGSCVLFGLYLLFKFFSKEYINYLLTAYFLVFGIGTMVMSYSPLIGLFAPASLKSKEYKISFNFLCVIPYVTPDMVNFAPTIVDMITCVFCCALSGWYVMEKHWIVNNILGFAFSLQAISMLNLGSYRIGCILLGGLFLYDIFWVFGTDVMVTVARSFDAPVKLLFPKDIFAAEYQFAMLGLGDIVIPGVFVALLLRFDAHLAGFKKSQKMEKASFPQTFFHVNCVAYILGLATTIGVMHFFQAAQPALLYLVPYVIGASLITAVVKGKLGELLMFEEEEGEKEKEQ